MNYNISRVNRSRGEASSYYSTLSWFYDFMTQPFEGRSKKLGLELFAAKKGEVLLEIGFGTGGNLVELAKRVGSTGQVYGIDISPGMLNIAANKIEKSGLKKIAQIQLGDAVKLPYEKGFFDGAFMSFTLELFDTPEIPLVLKECYRVLKPKGRLGLVSMGKRKKTSIVTKIYERLHHYFPKYVDCRPIPTAKILELNRFHISSIKTTSLMGLPIDIIVAKKAV